MGETSENTLLTTPDRQATFGLNATVVYGEAVTAVVGASTSVVLGSNANFCFNPATLLHRGADMPKVFKAFAMGGAGGNLSFTIGSKADIVMGPRYEVNWGGKVELDLGNAFKDGKLDLWGTSAKKVNNSFGITIAILIATFFFVYGFDTDQNRRSGYLVSLQCLLNTLLTILVSIDALYKNADTTLSQSMEWLVKAESPECKEITGKMWAQGGVSLLANMIVPVVLPPIAAATAEGHFGPIQK